MDKISFWVIPSFLINSPILLTKIVSPSKDNLLSSPGINLDKTPVILNSILSVVVSPSLYPKIVSSDLKRSP